MNKEIKFGQAWTKAENPKQTRNQNLSLCKRTNAK